MEVGQRLLLLLLSGGGASAARSGVTRRGSLCVVC